MYKIINENGEYCRDIAERRRTAAERNLNDLDSVVILEHVLLAEDVDQRR